MFFLLGCCFSTVQQNQRLILGLHRQRWLSLFLQDTAPFEVMVSHGSLAPQRPFSKLDLVFSRLMTPSRSNFHKGVTPCCSPRAGLHSQLLLASSQSMIQETPALSSPFWNCFGLFEGILMLGETNEVCPVFLPQSRPVHAR